MDVENIDITLLKSECYICLEACLHKSPCECASHVHPKCLIQFLETEYSTFLICTGQYPVPPSGPSRIPLKKLLIIAVYCILFFPFGWFGSCISGGKYEPFSVSSFFSATSGYFIMILVWVCLIRR